MQRSISAWKVALVALVAVAVMAGSSIFGVGAAVGTAVSPTSSAPLAPTAWTPAELGASPTVAAPYSEPGLGLSGSTYLGPANFVSPSDPTGTVSILVSLAFSNGIQLDQFLAALSDPSSPQYHHYLTHDQFNQEYGGNPAIYTSLVQYLSSFGVTSLTTHPDRLTVTFQATPAQLTSIFHVNEGSYLSPSGQPYYAPTSSPTIPAPLAPYIIDVEGLSDYSMYLHQVASQAVPMALSGAEASAVGAPAAASASAAPTASNAPIIAGSAVSPGGALNPFASTTVTSNGLTKTYDVPPLNNSQTNGAQGRTGSCGAATCGEFMQAPALQVTYNETGLFAKYGYPVNTTVVALLWADTVCTANTSTCQSDGYWNTYCGTLSSGNYAWDFFMPDVTTFWNYSIPAGEPMPTAISMPITGSGTYAWTTASQGYSASCDSGGAEGENTLDVDMLGSMAPGANVFQVFGQGSSTANLLTEFADILSPTTAEFSNVAGTSTQANVNKLLNTSVITNSWTGAVTEATWASDEKTAQALGITVLGATGDSGTTLAAPAEISFNTYGTIAVGGTTTVISPTTLARTPDHVASMPAPYYGVGGGEIGWYEPVGTVSGFTSTYGGTEGVASSASYWRATWVNASSDASAVANVIRSGNFRAEADIAAISNDTLVNLQQGYVSGNITCWVLPHSSCAVDSPIVAHPVVLTSFYFIGTSIATQVAGGEIAVIDHSLYIAHQGKVGFTNPSSYAMGQLQYSSQLTLHSFYDVSVYTDAGGLTTGYPAQVGYDLATGWGVIDAGNYTQNTLTYNITFAATGVPSGLSWSVALTPTIGDANCVVSGSSCSNTAITSVTSSGGTSTVTVPEAYGTYTYTASASLGGTVTPSSGTVVIRSSSVPLTFTVSGYYPLSFHEVGLASGTWGVTFGGITSHAAVGTDLTFNAGNGTYNYNFSGHAGYTVSAWSGSLTLNGAPSLPTVTVLFVPVTYPVTVTESGLPSGTTWAVTLNGVLQVSSTTTLTTSRANGSYSYTVAAIGVTGYTASSPSGTLPVTSSGASLTETFSQSTATYTLYFTASGLPTGTSWSVTVDGSHTSTGSTATLSVASLAAGSHVYTVGVPAGYTASSPAGSVTIIAASVSTGITFSMVTYTVTFTESGLPGSTLWALSFGGTFYFSTTTTIVITAAPGSYTWTIAHLTGHTPTPLSGTTNVINSSVGVSISFT